MNKLYELPENQNIKLYIEDKIIIFGHLDGFYSIFINGKKIGD